MVPNPDMEPNTVMNVFQKGYTLQWAGYSPGDGCGFQRRLR